MTFLDRIQMPGITGLIEILVLAVLLYYIFLFFQGSRGAQVLSGLMMAFVGLLFLTNALSLDILNWLLQRFTVYLAVALLIIFQPEIRRALAQLGRRHVFGNSVGERSLIEALVKGVIQMADEKIGALIAIEREVGTVPVQETGTPIDSVVTPELLQTIFYPNTILHDGGVIIRGDRLVAAGCVFPLSQKPELSKALGTRHRAAIGLTEETDALVLVVSEETGSISVAYKGRLRRGLDAERLERFLSSILLKNRTPKNVPSRLRRWLEAWRAIRPRVRTTDTPEADAHGL
jgi:diadenylate cyclase